MEMACGWTSLDLNAADFDPATNKASQASTPDAPSPTNANNAFGGQVRHELD